MGIAAIASLVMLAAQTIQQMRAEGRDQTTAEEQQALSDAVAAASSEDQRFDGPGK